MSYAVRVNEELQILEATFSEIVPPEELRNGVTEALGVAKRRGINLFLTDCSNLRGGHSVVDLYFLADQLVALNFDPAQFREAIILPAADSETTTNVRFWEDTCFNRGYKVEAFFDRHDAIQWLVQQDSTRPSRCGTQESTDS